MRGKTWMQNVATIFAARMSGQTEWDWGNKQVIKSEVDFAANVADAIFDARSERNEDQIKKALETLDAEEAENPGKSGLVDEIIGGPWSETWNPGMVDELNAGWKALEDNAAAKKSPNGKK